VFFIPSENSQQMENKIHNEGSDVREFWSNGVSHIQNLENENPEHQASSILALISKYKAKKEQPEEQNNDELIRQELLMKAVSLNEIEVSLVLSTISCLLFQMPKMIQNLKHDHECRKRIEAIEEAELKKHSHLSPEEIKEKIAKAAELVDNVFGEENWIQKMWLYVFPLFLDKHPTTGFYTTYITKPLLNHLYMFNGSAQSWLLSSDAVFNLYFRAINKAVFVTGTFKWDVESLKSIETEIYDDLKRLKASNSNDVFNQTVSAIISIAENTKKRHQQPLSTINKNKENHKKRAKSC
jgi:hypothetical protein